MAGQRPRISGDHLVECQSDVIVLREKGSHTGKRYERNGEATG